MAEKNFSVEFYQIELSKDAEPFENYLSTLLKGYIRDYANPFFGDIHRSTLNNHWYGSVNVVKKDFLPQIYNTDNNTARDMMLNDSEGLLSVCSFMYVPAKKLLLVLKDFGAPGFRHLLTQVKEKNEINKCEALILLKKEMYEQLKNASSIKNFIFKIAKIAPDALSNNNNAISFLKSLCNIRYGEISVTLKSSKGNEIDKKWVVSIIDFFRQQPKDQIKDLRVKICSDDEEHNNEILNMLDYAFVKKVTISTTNKTLQQSERERALERAYNDSKNDLKELGL